MKQFNIQIQDSTGKNLCVIEYTFNKKDFCFFDVERTSKKKVTVSYLQRPESLLINNDIFNAIKRVEYYNRYKRDGIIYKIPSVIIIETDQPRTDEISFVDTTPQSIRLLNEMIGILMR